MCVLLYFSTHTSGLYINLYSPPASGSKERNIQTYKYGEKATKEKKQRKKLYNI